MVTRTVILRKKSSSRRGLFWYFNSRVYLNRAAPVLTDRRKKLAAKTYLFLESRQKVSKTFLSGLVDLWGVVTVTFFAPVHRNRVKRKNLFFKVTQLICPPLCGNEAKNTCSRSFLNIHPKLYCDTSFF